MAALFCASGFVAFSVWIESRFPGDDTKRALLPAAQRVVTKPIVNALGRQLERYVRRRAEVLFLETGLTLDETIKRFLDDRIDLSQRRIYAYRLARVGSPECIAALQKVLNEAPPEHKAFLAQLIGSTGNPAAKESLWPLLTDPDPRVALAAMRGLSAIGGEDATARWSDILGDAQAAGEFRIEAALGLGTIGTEQARAALKRALSNANSTELIAQVLNSLGESDFSTVRETFQQFLADPAASTRLRVAAVEALARSSTDAVPFLLGLAETDSAPEVRASAAWAISVHETVTDLAPALTELVQREVAADVRRRLYEALLNQGEIPAERLLPGVLAEDDLAARVAGFNAIARAVAQNRVPEVAAIFEQQIVPELLQIATQPNSLNLQMRSVFALRRAQTEAAQSALAQIADLAQPQIATTARNGLRPPGI